MKSNTTINFDIHHSKNKWSWAKTTHLLQKQIADGKNQSSGQYFLVKGHPSTWCFTAQCVHDVDFRVSFCFPVTLFYERASEWQSCMESLCSFADDSPRMTALEP